MNANDVEPAIVVITTMDGNTIVQTMFAPDGLLPYEVCVSCPRYNRGQFVSVGATDTVEKAHHLHNYWVGKMAADLQPAVLKDIKNTEEQRKIEHPLIFPRLW